MNPLVRATAATLALVGGSSFVASNNDAQQAPPKRVLNSVLDENFIPPWLDDYTHHPTMAPTLPPTLPPTLSPTTPPPTGQPSASPTEVPTQAPVPTTSPTVPPPTNAPTVSPPTNPPTKAPVEILVGAGAITTKLEDHYETSCTLLPEIGNFVTETLDIEYFLYLSDVEGSLDDADLQGIVDGSIEPRLHEALVDAGLGCDNTDFLNKYVMVDLSTSGRDLIGAECVIDDDFSLGNNVTDCYTVWGQVEATMWFSPRRRNLQEATTPFGDREAFSEFTQWMEEAMDSLAGYEIAETDATVIKASFRGFANVNEFDEATEVDLQKDLGVDITAAFTDSALSADDGGISLAWGLVAIVVGSLVLIMAIVVVALRRKRNRKAFMEHVQVVEDLALDSKDEIDNVCDIVDDESLFKQDKPLPEKYHVKLESADHDYRWIGEKRNEGPIFVATERNKEFRDHLATLKRKKEQEVAAQQYEMAML